MKRRRSVHLLYPLFFLQCDNRRNLESMYLERFGFFHTWPVICFDRLVMLESLGGDDKRLSTNGPFFFSALGFFTTAAGD